MIIENVFRLKRLLLVSTYFDSLCWEYFTNLGIGCVNRMCEVVLYTLGSASLRLLYWTVAREGWVEGSVERSGNPWCITGQGVGCGWGGGVGLSVCEGSAAASTTLFSNYSPRNSQTYSRLVTTSNISVQAMRLVSLLWMISLLSWFSYLFVPICDSNLAPTDHNTNANLLQSTALYHSFLNTFTGTDLIG